MQALLGAIVVAGLIILAILAIMLISSFQARR